MYYQPILDIASLCAKKGIDQIVLCPGSRCAPLTLAFTRHPHFKVRTFSDERSAGFIGLGMAQQTDKPVVLVCTSGTAAYNFAPAVAEAYFSNTPIVVFTADRPAEWIAQHDGQTIHQSDIFGMHVKKSFHLPQDYQHPDSAWAINRIVNEAINLSNQEPRGPVHINAPFREPLYPDKSEVTRFNENIRVIAEHQPGYELTQVQKEYIQKQWPAYNRILIVAGQQDADEKLQNAVDHFLAKHPVPVVADIISNLNASEQVIKHSDLFLGNNSEDLKKTLQPDLLITFGKSLISKNLKLFLRKYFPQAHWHIQPAGPVADTFKNTTDIFHATPQSFLNFITSLSRDANFNFQKQNNYGKLWEVEERRIIRCLQEFAPQGEMSELEVVQAVMAHLPAQSNLHLANSMSVRYANFIGLQAQQSGIKVFSNRGTSGIDGCTSTSVGHALTSDNLNVLVTGDMAFFYDRNAFWHNYPLPNLRVLLLNNHGGLIFNMIDGPATQPEAREYFITQQRLSAYHLCQEFGFDHLKLDNKRKLKNYINDFFDIDGRTKILEFESDIQLNRNVMDNLKQKIKMSYER